MSDSLKRRIRRFLLVVFIGTLSAGRCKAQGSQGTITVTVLDETGAVVPGAELTLQDLSTNDTRKATTQAVGNYSFVGLNIGTYKLSVSKSGYATIVYDTVVVHASLVTDIKATFKVAPITETISVTAEEAPLVESTSSVISSNIDLKQIEYLPLGDRDLTQLAFLTPGYTPAANTSGTWNGIPEAAQVNSIDGVIGNSSRFKDGGNVFAAASPRIQNIQEMAVQTSQLDADQGYGQAAMQVAFTTRRGTNQYHGRLFADLQNSSFNANSWESNYFTVPIPKYHKNDFGGDVAGPILKDKLFFFFSLERDGIPGSQLLTQNQFPPSVVMTPAMQRGDYTYMGTDSALHTVNLFTLASAQPGLRTQMDSAVANEVKLINNSLQYGNLETIPGLYNTQVLSFAEPNNQIFWYPTVRVDYNISQNFRVNFALNESKFSAPTAQAQTFPGPDFAKFTDGTRSKAYTAAIGFDWTVRPTLINQFRGGYLYNYTDQNPKSRAGNYNQKYPINWWNGPDGLNPGSGVFFYSGITNLYPLVNFSDNLIWQHGSHNWTFGGSFYREQDHYWNPPQGYDNVVFGDWPGDPMNNVFNSSNPALATATGGQIGEMQSFYAILTGDIGILAGSRPINPKTHQYQKYGALNLDELQKGWALYFRDSWRLRSNLTVNYGLRWDFTGDDHDLNGIYYSPTLAGLWGPSGQNNLFQPGASSGDPNPAYIARSHAYNPWNVSPQPSLGIAWSPQATEGIWGKLIGGGKTVLRTGYSLRRFTEQYQSFWQYASNFGSFFYQNYQTQGNPTAAPGFFVAGTVHYDQYLNNPSSLPPFLVTPSSYSAQISEASQAWQSPFQGMNPNIAQPYIQSWNFGIQREVGKVGAIEIRYVGNRGVHEWVGLNLNEVNIFQSGFLNQFKIAQQNLAINAQHGITSFANNGYAGQQPTPIFDAAFAGEPSGGPGVPLLDYGPVNPFIQELLQGQVGSMAAQISSPFGFNANYFCNLISPTSTVSGAAGPLVANSCKNNLAYGGSFGAYPVNLFQVNPYNAGGGVGYLDSVGYSNYNGLQLEFRQRSWHGMQFNANYTWSKNLAMTNQCSLRNLRLCYGPGAADRRHVVHAYGTYDLPFGKGRTYLSKNPWLDRLVGGFTLGTIIQYTSGAPFQITGGNQTFNNLFDGGIVLNGLTASRIQSAIGLFTPPASSGLPGNARYWINPKFIGANSSTFSFGTSAITPNEAPGTIGALPWFYGLHNINTDLSLAKAFTIKEGVRFRLQGEFLNAFNHPTWGIGSTNLQDPNFGVTSAVGGSRVIEVRANFEF